MAKDRGVIPRGDVLEPSDTNVGYDALRVLGKVGAPTIDLGFGTEPDFLEGSLLASLSPPLRDERREEEARVREAVDGRVDELLGK